MSLNRHCEMGSSEMDNRPRYFIPYPVAPIQICRYLGFCLGRATELMLEAPWKGGAEDCREAQRYLTMTLHFGEQPISACRYRLFQQDYQKLARFMESAGDNLWEDISSVLYSYFIQLDEYLVRLLPGNIVAMSNEVDDLRRILALRDTTGQIYDGMSGLPQVEAGNAQD